MLERPHSTPYMEQELSFLWVYADPWIGKPDVLPPRLTSVARRIEQVLRTGAAHSRPGELEDGAHEP